MPIAIDTIQGIATNPGPAGAAITIASGDSLNVRSFNPTSKAAIHFLSRQGTTAGFVRVRSPRLHDATKGITFFPGETPVSSVLLPPQIGQPVYALDALIIEVAGGTAETDAVALGIYYDDLPGSAAIVKDIATVQGNMVNIKVVEVDVTQGATAYAWVDTKVNTTEDLLKANKYYAVLGYDTDTVAMAIGVKGPETGNYRCAGPGPTLVLSTTDYFAKMAFWHQKPYLPVFNSNNRNGYFVSTSQLATTGTTKVSLVLAELVDGFAP